MARREKPLYEPEWHEVRFRVPTGRLVCHICYSPQGEQHTKHCHWNPINTAKDNALFRAEERAKKKAERLAASSNSGARGGSK